MKTTAAVALLGCAGVASSVAQTPAFTYQFNAPVALAPGATATITVLCAFTPGVGQPVGTQLGPLPVMGLESGGFSIVGNGGGWSNLALIYPVNWLFLSGTPVGGSVNGVVWGTGFVPPAVPSTVNPTPIWRGTFTMPDAPATLMLVATAQHGLWAGPHQPSGFPLVAYGPPTGAVVNIALVPAPAGTVGLALGLPFAFHRRRAGFERRE